MSQDLIILLTTAASIAFVHTLLGPDHYLPFILMSKSRKWSMAKTTWISSLCGIGHILGSFLLGMVGIFIGFSILQIKGFESFRGELVAWIFIAFGMVYLAWGLKRSFKSRSHEHYHSHGDGGKHIHVHNHTDEHVHVHNSKKKKELTPWVLFTIFVLGPCEPLIPLLMYPAAKNSLIGIILVVFVFGIVTVLTMLGLILSSYLGLSFIPTKRLERHMHTIAGGTIALCGAGIILFGL